MFSAHLQKTLPAKILSSHASVMHMKMATNSTFTTQTKATVKPSASYAPTWKRPETIGIRDEAAMTIATVCPTIAKWKPYRTFPEDNTIFREWLRGRKKKYEWFLQQIGSFPLLTNKETGLHSPNYFSNFLSFSLHVSLSVYLSLSHSPLLFGWL